MYYHFKLLFIYNYSVRPAGAIVLNPHKNIFAVSLKMSETGRTFIVNHYLFSLSEPEFRYPQ